MSPEYEFVELFGSHVIAYDPARDEYVVLQDGRAIRRGQTKQDCVQYVGWLYEDD